MDETVVLSVGGDEEAAESESNLVHSSDQFARRIVDYPSMTTGQEATATGWLPRIARARWNGGMQTNEVEAVVGELGVTALDHTAIAVQSFESALPLFRDLLGGEPNQMGEEGDRGFRWLALRFPNGSFLELLEPIGEEGFLQEFLAKRGEGVHHLTFTVADVRHSVERARSGGLRVVDENYADPLWQEAYVSPRSAHGTIVQLVQTPLSREERAERWSAQVYRREVGDSARA